MANHLSETPPNSKVDAKKPNVEARVNGETLCAVAEPTTLLDGEHVVERVNSKGNLVGSGPPPPHPPAAIGVVQAPDGAATTNGSAAVKLGGATTESHHPSSASSSCSSSGISQLGNVAREDGAPPAPLKAVNSTELDDDRSLDFPDDSRDSYPPPDLSEPLPEMSVQEAESVLGMSPAPYPNHDGPGTPSTGVPSPTHFPSHFQKQHRIGSMGQPSTPGSAGTPTGGNRGGGGGSQDFSMDSTDMGAVSTAGGVNTASGPAPSSYPPPYPTPMDVPPGNYPPHHVLSSHPSLYGPSPHPSNHGYPPYNNPMFPPNRHYGDMPGDYSSHHPGGSMMQHPYSGGRGPYPSGMPVSSGSSHRNSVDYHPHHHPHHGPYPHPQMMGGARDVPPYPSSQGMTQSEWHWQQHHHQQQQRQMMSAQQSQIYQRMQQQQQQHAAMMRQQQAAMAMQQQHSSSRSSPAISSPETAKPSWHHHNQTHSHKAHPTSSSATASASASFVGGSSMSKMSSEKARSSHHKPHPHPRHHTEALENKPQVGAKPVSDMSTAPTATSQASTLPESLKRTLPDWSNCVEGTKPQLVKRRKLYSYHCGELANTWFNRLGIAAIQKPMYIKCVHKELWPEFI